MSGRLLRLVCTAVVTAGIVLAPVPAAAEPGPGPAEGAPGDRTVAGMLTDLQRLYREAEQATESYNGTEERLKKQRARVLRLNAELTRTRLSLRDSRGAAGRLARRQYQSSSALSPYLRLLLARDPQHALDQGHVIGRLSKERAETVGRLTGDARKADELAGRARAALDEQVALAARQVKERDAVRERLRAVEEMLASLTPEQLAALAELERSGAEEEQERFLASGALGDDAKPSAEGDRGGALRGGAARQAVRVGRGGSGVVRLLRTDLRGLAAGRDADPADQPGAVGAPGPRAAGRTAPR
ncbi:hypothetical protein RKD32_005007 [Streptomyces sp. SAI-195]